MVRSFRDSGGVRSRYGTSGGSLSGVLPAKKREEEAVKEGRKEGRSTEGDAVLFVAHGSVSGESNCSGCYASGDPRLSGKDFRPVTPLGSFVDRRFIDFAQEPYPVYLSRENFGRTIASRVLPIDSHARPLPPVARGRPTDPTRLASVSPPGGYRSRFFRFRYVRAIPAQGIGASDWVRSGSPWFNHPLRERVSVNALEQDTVYQPPPREKLVYMRECVYGANVYHRFGDNPTGWSWIRIGRRIKDRSEDGVHGTSRRRSGNRESSRCTLLLVRWNNYSLSLFPIARFKRGKKNSSRSVNPPPLPGSESNRESNDAISSTIEAPSKSKILPVL